MTKSTRSWVTRAVGLGYLARIDGEDGANLTKAVDRLVRNGSPASREDLALVVLSSALRGYAGPEPAPAPAPEVLKKTRPPRRKRRQDQPLGNRTYIAPWLETMRAPAIEADWQPLEILWADFSASRRRDGFGGGSVTSFRHHLCDAVSHTVRTVGCVSVEYFAVAFPLGHTTP